MLALMGLVKEATGHVSVRIPGTNELLVRARGRDENGLLFTGPDDVVRATFDGETTETSEGVALPQEFPIHGEIYKARPDVNCVVHAHPPYILRCGIAGVELRPIFGAFDPSSMSLVANGIPVYPRSITVTTNAYAADLIGAMGESPVCLMRGHGITAVGGTLAQGTIRAIKMEALAEINWDVSSRGPVTDISDEDMTYFRERGQLGAGNTGDRGSDTVFRYYIDLLEHRGLGL